MRGFFLIVGCLFFWTYILKDSRFENKRDSTLEGSRYVSACLLSGPLIRRKRERSLFLSISPCYYVHCESCPFFPPIRTRSNMAGPPELRALLQRRDSFQKLLGLKFHPPLPFKKKEEENTVPVNCQAFIFGVFMIEGFIVRRKWEWFYFFPLPKKTGSLVHLWRTSTLLVVLQRSPLSQLQFGRAKQSWAVGTGLLNLSPPLTSSIGFNRVSNHFQSTS